MKRLLALALLAAFAACKKEPPAPRGMTRYTHARPKASVAAPETWRVLENQGGAHIVSFLGPAEGDRPYSQSLGLYFHKADGVYGSPREYARAQELAGTRKTQTREREWKGRKALELVVERDAARRLHSTEREKRRERMALVPSQGGFYLLLASAPAGEAAALDALFDAALDTLDVP